MKAIIIDDEKRARHLLSNLLTEHCASITSIEEAQDLASGVDLIKTSKPDVVFLDINMPEISGIAFAKSINKNIKIIFTTAYRDYAVEGFNLQAVDYLLKPISFERLLQAVNRYFEVHTQQTEVKSLKSTANDFIFVRAERRMQKINFDEIIYIESLSDYIKIHLQNKIIVTRETISAIDAKLPQQDFLRIHRSYIVNLSKIESFTNEEITLKNTSLTISRSYKKEVLNRLERF